MTENVYCIYRRKIEKLGERIVIGLAIVFFIVFVIGGAIFPFAMMLGYISPINPDGTPSDLVFFGSLFSVMFVGILTIVGEYVATEYKTAISNKTTVNEKVLNICAYASFPALLVITVPSVLYMIFMTSWDISAKVFLILASAGAAYVFLHGILSFLCEKENYRRYSEDRRYLEAEMPKATE